MKFFVPLLRYDASISVGKEKLVRQMDEQAETNSD
jgi:hypothetical protein